MFYWDNGKEKIALDKMSYQYLVNVQNQLLQVDFERFDSLTTLKEYIGGRDAVENNKERKLKRKNYLIKALQEITKEIIKRRKN